MLHYHSAALKVLNLRFPSTTRGLLAKTHSEWVLASNRSSFKLKFNFNASQSIMLCTAPFVVQAPAWGMMAALYMTSRRGHRGMSERLLPEFDGEKALRSHTKACTS